MTFWIILSILCFIATAWLIRRIFKIDKPTIKAALGELVLLFLPALACFAMGITCAIFAILHFIQAENTEVTMLNPSKGNMYSWVTHTWNPVKGECPHGCEYCYMLKWGPQKPVRFVPSEFKTDLGAGNTIFVGSSCDMWADAIPADWIHATLGHCNQFQENQYLFQSKNPHGFCAHHELMPENVVLGTTIESDLWHRAMGRSPEPIERAAQMIRLRHQGYTTMVTIEPVMDFYLSGFVDMIRAIGPAWVNIGANTNRRVDLKEPAPEKLQAFIGQLGDFTEVKVKSNLRRLLPAATLQA